MVLTTGTDCTAWCWTLQVQHLNCVTRAWLARTNRTIYVNHMQLKKNDSYCMLAQRKLTQTRARALTVAITPDEVQAATRSTVRGYIHSRPSRFTLNRYHHHCHHLQDCHHLQACRSKVSELVFCIVVSMCWLCTRVSRALLGRRACIHTDVGRD